MMIMMIKHAEDDNDDDDENCGRNDGRESLNKHKINLFMYYIF